MTRRRRVSLIVLTWVLSACSTLVRVPEAPVAGRGGPPIEAYARVPFVNDRGEVDFSALARDRADPRSLCDPCGGHALRRFRREP
jgi:hypothetical protein